jgi:hypothetical protein
MEATCKPEAHVESKAALRFATSLDLAHHFDQRPREHFGPIQHRVPERVVEPPCVAPSRIASEELQPLLDLQVAQILVIKQAFCQYGLTSSFAQQGSNPAWLLLDLACVARA